MSEFVATNLAWMEERDKLFALSEYEVSQLPNSEKYMRMRYEREIEGYEYVMLLREGLSYTEAMKQARINADFVVANWQNKDVLRETFKHRRALSVGQKGKEISRQVPGSARPTLQGENR